MTLREGELPAEQLVTVPKELLAVRAFVHTGSMAAAAREIGEPIATIRAYAKTVWWQDEVAALQRDNMARLDASLTKILDSSIDALLTRITEGDTVLTKKGKVQVPLKADTLNRIADVVFTKRQLLRNQPTAIAGDTKKLNTLALKLKALGARDVTILENGSATPEEE